VIDDAAALGDPTQANLTQDVEMIEALAPMPALSIVQTAFQLLRGPGAGDPGASGLCATSAPLITSLVATCASLITSLVATCAPLVTPFHTGRLGFSI
jgi:hypothetical protein